MKPYLLLALFTLGAIALVYLIIFGISLFKASKKADEDIQQFLDNERE